MGKFIKDVVIIQEILNNLGSLTRTKIVKLLYLLDIESTERYGKKLTDFEYKKYYYGPYDQKIVSLLDNPKYFNVTLGVTSSGSQFYNYSVGPRKPTIPIDSMTKDLVDEIVNKYGRIHLDKILEIAYDTQQFKVTDFGEKIKFH